MDRDTNKQAQAIRGQSSLCEIPGPNKILIAMAEAGSTATGKIFQNFLRFFNGPY
jgi:hypothetical protein